MLFKLLIRLLVSICCILGMFPLVIVDVIADEEVVVIPVSAKSFKKLAIFPVVQVSATVLSLNNSKLSAEVSAVIKDVLVDVGQTVESGSVLLKLDPSFYQLEYERSSASVLAVTAKHDLAAYELQRAKSLSKKKIVSEEALARKTAELLALSGELKVQKALRDIAKRNLNRCTVRAPFKAIIKARLANVGELARIGTPLVHIVDAEKLEISAKIQTSDIDSLKSAEKIELVSQGGRFNIKLKNITPAYDSFERSQEVRFSFVITNASEEASSSSNTKPGVKESDLPGAFGKIIWNKTMPHIPADLMVRREGNLGIFILQGNKSKFVNLSNAKEGQPVAQSQLSEDVPIVVDGRYRLQDGSSVKLKLRDL